MQARMDERNCVWVWEWGVVGAVQDDGEEDPRWERRCHGAGMEGGTREKKVEKNRKGRCLIWWTQITKVMGWWTMGDWVTYDERWVGNGFGVEKQTRMDGWMTIDLKCDSGDRSNEHVTNTYSNAM